MGGADIAYVATAGAAGLAVAVSAWAWRLKSRLAAQSAPAAVLNRLAGETAARDAALSAFGDIRLRLNTDGRVTGAFGEADQIEALGGVEALRETLEAAAPGRLDALAGRGEPFDQMLPAGDRVWKAEGRSLSGEAWVRLAPAESTLDPAESGLGRLTDLSPLPTWIVDGTGALAWANRAFLAETRHGDLAGAIKAGASFDRGADALVAEARRSGVRQEGFRWTAAQGRRRAWRITAEPTPGGAGAVVAFAVDVTEAEETRDTLRRHVEAHDETLNHLGDAVAIFGPSKRLAFHNTAFQGLFGLEQAWLDERPTHGELLDRLRQRRLLPEVVDYAGWKARELDFYGAAQAAPDDSWSLPDGRTLRVVRQPHPLGGVLLIFSDMTDELRLKSRYNAQIQVQRATLDKLNDAVAVFGSDGRLRLHNDAFERFWNLSGERLNEAGDFEAVATLCKPVLPDAALWLGLKARVADPDPESRIPIAGEGRTADGRIAAWQTRPLPDGATLVAFSDITARRELEDALRAKQAALEESQALKREFVGNVSYELRTPLTTIVGYSELLEAQGELPERSRQHAGAIRVAASQLARSIDDVLDMAQIDAGEMELTRHEVRLAALLQGAADRIRPKIEGRGAGLTLRLQSGLRVVWADERRLAQAVDHLLENAARAVSEGGEVVLAAEGAETEVRIRVSDTGRGIPYHLQPNVFDRFVRRERGGPGVGLALVKALVELHEGWAEVESEPGKGATFTLHLPYGADAQGLRA